MNTTVSDTRLTHDAGSIDGMNVDAPPVSPSLSRNFAWSFCGNLVFSGSQWGIVVALAKFGDAAMVGQFALAIAITSPIMLFAGCALRTVQATDHASDFTFGDYLGFRLLTVGLALLAIVGVASMSDVSLATRGVIVAVGCAKAFESLSDLFHGALQQRENMDQIGKAMIVRGVVTLVATWGALLASNSLLVASLAFAVSGALVFVLLDMPFEARQAQASLRPRFAPATLVIVGRLALPLGLTVMLGALIANVPRYAIEHYLGDEQLGLFAALAYVTIFGNLVANAIAHAALPRLSRYWADDDRTQFRKLIGRLLAIGTVLGIVGVAVGAFAGPTLLALVYRSEYAERNDVFLALIASMSLGLLVCFLDSALYAARWFRVQVPINVVVLAITWGASIVVIPRFELLGAAWLVCLTMALQLAARLVVVVMLMLGLSSHPPQPSTP
jgi:O-antigen/teichoic acid export membrane protein